MRQQMKSESQAVQQKLEFEHAGMFERIYPLDLEYLQTEYQTQINETNVS